MLIAPLDLKFQHLDSAIAAFVVQGPEGHVLVECGPASTLTALEQGLAGLRLTLADIRHLFVSHIHFDHAGAAWAFAQHGATVYVHPKGAPHLAAPEKLYNSAKMIYGDAMDTLWGAMHPIPEAQLHAPTHGEKITAAGLTCTAWHTPGHAVHHIAWQVEAPDGTTTLFAGDVAGVRIGTGPVVPPCPPPDIHVGDWLESIALMRQLPVATLWLTHFGQINDKSGHLDALEAELSAWATWMRPYAEQKASPESVTPLFMDFVNDRYRAVGLSEDDIKRYEAANPAFMSVAGLLRYWTKIGMRDEG